MALWDKLKTELDRAGRVAQEAFDEGKIRLELFRARQSADRYAQRLGYAVFRARKENGELSPEDYAAYASDLAAAEAEITRYETLLEEARQRGKTGPDISPETPPGSPS
jgi:hypothetical protein